VREPVLAKFGILPLVILCSIEKTRTNNATVTSERYIDGTCVSINPSKRTLFQHKVPQEFSWMKYVLT